MAIVSIHLNNIDLLDRPENAVSPEPTRFVPDPRSFADFVPPVYLKIPAKEQKGWK
jgi:hypothetical protein